MNSSVSTAETASNNRRGIPTATFIDNVDEYMKGKEFDITINEMVQLSQKYRFMEQSLNNRLDNFSEKFPEIEKNLDIVGMLAAKRDKSEAFTTQYELSDSVYAKANIGVTGRVGLWLGANVMLEYSISEAIDVLQKNLDACTVSIKQLSEDLEYLREQMTIVDVNTNRIYNYDVKSRRK